ncbi:Eco57I restriction-modification methylase domain-containing protein [Microvirga sp. M2]|uniref:Eco57I restriction-modification methylase domain-containing protein n=1 Tax=Microvirga sp. M2 TaxID=3073270 RepID=UPI0039C20F57
MRSLLAISYNNLVEWHIFVSQTDIRQVNNLAEPSNEPNADRVYPLSPSEFTQRLSAAEVSRLEAENFKRTLRACDEALIQVLTRWKRLLRADYPAADNTSISALFNALIFVRGCEDRNLDRPHRTDRALMAALNSVQTTEINLGTLLSDALRGTGVDRRLSEYVDLELIAPFNAVDKATALNLCRDFYAPRDASYDFNFAVMSKHALSRIYERYVALLQPEPEANSQQLYFISPTPSEVAPSKTGAVYTPQFIAGFFSRYIRDNTTPRKFRTLRAIDPACGSGIFLRTLLELQCNPTIPGTTPASIRDAFSRTEGLDRDPNACAATRLSLALLHLVATGALPEGLPVRTADAIAEASANRIEPRSYGAVLSNPPYIKYDHLSVEDRAVFRTYLGEGFPGRLDAYIPFVKLCLDATEPSGFACMVLPQVFLNAGNAAPLRQLISEEFDVRCLVDLSSVSVFEGVGAYSILLIVQRRTGGGGSPVKAYLAHVTEFVGAALQACLDGRTIDTPYHRVFSVGQHFFRNKDWAIVSPEHLAIDERLKQLPQLSQFIDVVQGFVTGADDVFIIPRSEVPIGEEGIYLNYLPDRQILRYRLPQKVDDVVFYPYEKSSPLTEETLATKYPQTWEYLVRNRDRLDARGPVRAGKTPWWRPERPREPDRIRRPKIVGPHLMLTPRFALDIKGQYAVSRSPFMIAKEMGEEDTLLKFFSAVLNSSVCNWYFKTYAPKYSRGYNRLEANLLKGVPVPDFSRIETAALHRVVSAVEKLQSGKAPASLDSETDKLIADLYGFSSHERRNLLGIE